jgi:enamine deaminase RidA (YjgF/YER057c/UK114 family)
MHPAPAGDYSSAVRFGDLVVTAGMTPKISDVLIRTGVVGRDVPLEDARLLAGIAAERALQAVDRMVDGTTSEVVPVQLTVYIRSDADFTEHSKVADGASAVIAERYGGSLPARAAVGVLGLPGGAPVEVVLAVGIVGK